MTYCNFFTQMMNFNFGAMLGNSLANIAGWGFFGSPPPAFGGWMMPGFGMYQYPSTFSMPPMYDNASLFVQPNNAFMYGNPSLFVQPNSNFGFNNSAFSAPIKSSFGTPNMPTTFGLGDSFNYSLPVTYKTPEIKPKKKEKKSDNPAIRDFGSKEVAAAKRMVENATYYVGKVNSDKEGNRLFSNGVSQAWCADFVTAITKKSYGDKLPSDFGTATRGDNRYGSCSVRGIKFWGEDNDCYKPLPNKESEKADFIAKNIKPGDIMIELRNGKSHTGIVTKVNDDGSFDVVEGNCSNSVKKCHYPATSDTLSGFVTMDQFA